MSGVDSEKANEVCVSRGTRVCGKSWMLRGVCLFHYCSIIKGSKNRSGLCVYLSDLINESQGWIVE